MPSLRLILRPSLLVTIAALAVACDPAGPGAAGNLSLAASVDARQFSWLEVRAYADAGGSFDPAQIPEDSPRQLNLALKDITFPYHYDVGEVLGTTDEQRWRMTAWLAATPSTQRPGTKDPQCSVAFELEKCGAQFGGYCGTKSNIDCTLE